VKSPRAAARTGGREVRFNARNAQRARAIISVVTCEIEAIIPGIT